MNKFNLGLGAALLVGAASIALVSGEAAPASGAASKVVTITLTDSGKARWSTDGDAEKGSLALNYGWSGKLRFKVPAKAFQSTTARFASAGAGTLKANWTGDATGTKFGNPYNGPYHCQYAGKDVPSKVTATLVSGQKRGTVDVTLHATNERASSLRSASAGPRPAVQGTAPTGRSISSRSGSSVTRPATTAG